MNKKQMFEFPTDMRDLAEKNVEQARVAYGQFMEFMSQAMNAWSASGVPEAKNFKAIQDRAVGFAKENAERSFALASELAQARDLQQVDDQRLLTLAWSMSMWPCGTMGRLSLMRTFEPVNRISLHWAMLPTKYS